MNITHLLATLVQGHESALDQMRRVRQQMLDARVSTDEAFDGLFSQLTAFRVSILKDYDDILSSLDRYMMALGPEGLDNDALQDAKDRTSGPAERDTDAPNWRRDAEPSSRK